MKLNNREVFDKNRQSQVDTGYNLLLQVPAGDAKTKQIGIEIKEITAKQYYYDCHGILKSCPVVLVGKPKKVSMESQPQRSEVSAVINTVEEVVRETEDARENRVSAPERESIVGLLTAGLGLVSSQLRKLRWN